MKNIRFLLPFLFILAILAVGCEDDSNSGVTVDAGEDVSGDIININGDGNTIRQNTSEDEESVEEEE